MSSNSNGIGSKAANFPAPQSFSNTKATQRKPLTTSPQALANDTGVTSALETERPLRTRTRLSSTPFQPELQRPASRQRDYDLAPQREMDDGSSIAGFSERGIEPQEALPPELIAFAGETNKLAEKAKTEGSMNLMRRLAPVTLLGASAAGLAATAAGVAGGGFGGMVVGCLIGAAIVAAVSVFAAVATHFRRKSFVQKHGEEAKNFQAQFDAFQQQTADNPEYLNHPEYLKLWKDASRLNRYLNSSVGAKMLEFQTTTAGVALKGANGLMKAAGFKGTAIDGLMTKFRAMEATNGAAAAAARHGAPAEQDEAPVQSERQFGTGHEEGYFDDEESHLGGLQTGTQNSNSYDEEELLTPSLQSRTAGHHAGIQVVDDEEAARSFVSEPAPRPRIEEIFDDSASVVSAAGTEFHSTVSHLAPSQRQGRPNSSSDDA